MLADTPTADSPFHQGERDIHNHLGINIEAWARKIIRDHMPKQHRDFYQQLPFLVVAARDSNGQPWATLIEGPEGFVSASNPTTLLINAKPAPGDAISESLSVGSDFGILGIELGSRRRNRVNGHIKGVSTGALEFTVEQSFGNCPQYIHARDWTRVSDNQPQSANRGNALTSGQVDWTEGADTFFIASGFRGQGKSASYGMDASHRGGEPGFVQVISPTRVRFPDYAGNNHFNTIGNIMSDGRAGFTFVNFDTGSLLQMTGRAHIDWDSDDVAKFPGARQLVVLDIEEIVELTSALSLRWSAEAVAVRTLRVVDKIKESADVTSFVFEARDGGALPAFEAGQHLPLELEIDGMKKKIARQYSLSGSPTNPRYRISVKREPHGLVSNLLHDHLEVGSFINAGTPAGDFFLPPGNRPVVLISAGVGVTPMMSMLHDTVTSEVDRDIWFIHGVRDGEHHPLKDEVLSIAERSPRVHTHFAYSRPTAQDIQGRDYESHGRVDAELVTELVGFLDAEFMICGPLQFMAELQQGLEAKGVGTSRIHWESFGPASG